MSILNSRCIKYYFKNKFAEFDDVFPKAKIGQCKELPISMAIEELEMEQWNSIIDRHIDSINILLDLVNKFNNYVISALTLSNSSKKLQNWYELEFSEFIKELNKAIKKQEALH